jgi:LysM repeat protein
MLSPRTSRRLAILLLLGVIVLLAGRPARAADILIRAPGPQPAAAPEPARPQGPLMPVVTLTIERGDTLWGLSQQFAVAIEIIEAANPGLEMQVGESVDIPLWPVRLVFWARGGEPLTDVADYYGVGLDVLMQANGLAADAVLEPGQRVWVLDEIPANGVWPEEVMTRVGDELHWTARMPAPVVGAISRSYGGPEIHRGVDIVAPYGTRIISPRAGVVTRVGGDQVYGTYVVISHGHVETLYAHLSEVLVGPGQEVKVGDVIGRVGDNGRSTGAHLHWELRVAGELQDPLQFVRGVGG